MIYRVLIGAGIFILGYYVGKEAKRAKPRRKQLHEEKPNKPEHEKNNQATTD